MMKNLSIALMAATFIGTFSLAGCNTEEGQSSRVTKQQVVQNYAEIVYDNYKAAHKDALMLQKAVDAFLASPTEKNLQKAKDAWLVSRDSYGQSEAFRFYEGPIDFVGDNAEGPEGRLNSWPLNEAYIDYVAGDMRAGIVQDGRVKISKASLSGKNQQTDEADVATGYHAIEFLLWGQDLDINGPGTRPVSDYAKTRENERRREYLKVVTDLLVDDLRFLVDSWKPGGGNYAAQFTSQDSDESLGHMITALATLSGFELASERLATALDSGDQEDEHSCFSDNTHKDFIMNARGVDNVFFGRYGGSAMGAQNRPSVYALLKRKDAKLADEISAQLAKTRNLAQSLPYPIDRDVLATPEGSVGRAKAEALVVSLQKQAELFVKAGQVLGVDSKIIME